MSNGALDGVVGEALKLNLAKASLAEIEGRLGMTLQAETKFDALYVTQQGESRARKFLENCQQAFRTELCEGGHLKKKYTDLLESGDTRQILNSLATTVLAIVNPAFAVPSVAVLVAVWLLKVGLTQWCGSGQLAADRKGK